MEKLQKFFSDNWAIQRQEFENLLSLLTPCIVNGNVGDAINQIEKPKSSVKAVNPIGANLAKWYELDDISLPVDSIAVINLTGVLYSWETDWLIKVIEQAELNQNICGIVLVIDGPGGMVSHIDLAVEAIEKCSKPVAALVSGLMASAHFWLGTAAQRTFIASKLCEVGSVGVVITYCSYKEFFKMNGIDYREIYPDTADLKNKETRVLESSGDESLIKERAERIHRAFSESVAKNLGIKYDPELPLFRGEMFTAEQAVKAKYVDEFGTLSDAVTWVLAQATSRKVAKLY